jgi:hypothetical protein
VKERRLERLAGEGDLRALSALLRQQQRRGDPLLYEEIAEAAPLLHPLREEQCNAAVRTRGDGVVELLVGEEWRRMRRLSEWEANIGLEELERRCYLGTVLRTRRLEHRRRCQAAEDARRRWAAASLSSRLAAVNGRRRTRVLDLAEVEAAIRQVANWPAEEIGRILRATPSGIVRVSGASYGYTAVSTIAVVARVARGVAVDIYKSGARGGLPPGEGLSYPAERPGRPSERVRSGTDRWASDTRRLRYSLVAARRLGTEGGH